jgi:hypothetical protein
VKYETTRRFDNDFEALLREHRRHFLDQMVGFNVACDNYVRDPGVFVWPKRLRVRQMTSVQGIWEMTWSFASPDGRATFEFIRVDGEPRVRWRRIGDHGIYKAP